MPPCSGPAVMALGETVPLLGPPSLSASLCPATTIYDSSVTALNSYTGGVYQQAISAVTDVNNANYGGKGFGTYGYEWWSDPKHRDSGYITWSVDGKQSWTITAASMAGDDRTGISARLIPEEPMYILFNLGIAPSFQKQDYKHMVFPGKMYVDYVRVYQRDGVKNSVTCDPGSRPTADYIKNHPEAYTNANWTTWAKAGYGFPRNSKYDGC